MTEENFVPTAPSYKGHLEVSGWVKKDKNGKSYITIKLASSCNLFKNESKPKEVPKPTGEL